MKNINDYHVNKKLDVPLNLYVYKKLNISTLVAHEYLDLLFALHDAEIIALVPDKNKLSIYVDKSDSYFIHSYVYNSYIFSFTTEYNQKWRIKGKAKSDYFFYQLILKNMKLPFTDDEILWLYEKRNIDIVKEYLLQLSTDDYNKYCRDYFLLKLAS